MNKKDQIKNQWLYTNDQDNLKSKTLNQTNRPSFYKLAKTINVNQGIIKLDNYCFGGCENLTEVTIPKSIKEIGADIFINCPNIRNIIFEGNIDTDFDFIKIDPSAFKSVGWLAESAEMYKDEPLLLIMFIKSHNAFGPIEANNKEILEYNKHLYNYNRNKMTMFIKDEKDSIEKFNKNNQ